MRWSSGTTFPKSRRNASATPRTLSVPAFSKAALLACGERKWVFGDGAVAEAAFEIMGVTNSEFLAIPATLVRDVPVAKLNGQIGGFIRSAAPEMVLIPVS
jgi:hypothetical protein